jgi:hypothetical protein
MNAAGLPTLYRDYGLRTLNRHSTVNMKLGGFLLLLAGWAIVVTALAILHGHVVAAFVYAGFGVEILGLMLVFRGHLPASGDEE